MSITWLKTKEIPLPPIENVEGLTAEDIMEKIRAFYIRFEKYDGECQDFMESYFLELLSNYPKSLCTRNMTESLKQLITIMYLASKPERKRAGDWDGYSYEDLAVMFDISKATVHEAIRQKEAEVKELLEDTKLRGTAKKIALEELIKEEKLKILEQNNQKNSQTEQTANSPPRRDIDNS
jgi:hypothetical protein